MLITENAVNKLRELKAEENDENLKFRVFVQGGGCSGFRYGFTFDNQQNEDDFDFPYENLTIVVDSMSMQYLNNAQIDYSEDDMGSSFTVKNPQAATTCGCGSSFGV